jgi:RNA polymerase sigma-70 factor (ECF subfamily)
MSDEQAEFEILFRETRAPLLAYFTRRVPADDAGDLLADVYLVAWRKRADLPPGEERRLWLYGVARRLLAEHRRTLLPWPEGEPVDVDEGPSPTADDERGATVRSALASLSDLDRELVTLTTWERLTPADAARVVGITAGTARVRLHRARARLARHPGLRALLDDPDGAREPGRAAGRQGLVLAAEP